MLRPSHSLPTDENANIEAAPRFTTTSTAAAAASARLPDCAVSSTVP